MPDDLSTSVGPPDRPDSPISTDSPSPIPQSDGVVCIYASQQYTQGARICVNGRVNVCGVDSDGSPRWYETSDTCS